MRKDTFSYGTDTVLIPIRYEQIRILLPVLTDVSSVPIFDNYQSFAADLLGPANNTRTRTDITDKIRIVTDRTDQYGRPIRSVRSLRKW